jgi:hypothetical protein
MAKVGVFSRNWNTLYKWEDRVLPFAVGTLEDSPQPVDIYDISILSPQNNQNVSGTVELRAAIDNLDVQSYDMGWRTGTGEFIPMQTDPTFSFKRAWIDFTPWNWRSDSIYPIQLQASDANDNVIANTTINVIH